MRSRPDTEVRLGAWAGLLGVTSGIAGLLVDRMWSFPGSSTTGTELLGFVTSHRTELLTAMLFNTVAVSMWLVFGSTVWAHLRRSVVADTVGTAWFGSAFIALVTLLLAGFTAFFVLVYRAPAGRDPLLLYDLAFALLAMSGAPTTIALGAYADMVLRTGAIRRSTALFALVGAAAHVALFASLVVRNGFWSLEGPVIIVIPGTFFAWIGATSIGMLRDSTSQSPP